MATDFVRTIEIAKRFATAVQPSERVLRIAAMFGLGVDDERELSVVPRTRVPIPPGGIIFITGPSGGGKTTILSLIAAQAPRQHCTLLRADALPELPDVPLVDAFDLPLEEVASLLARVGLSDAFVMLRKPGELSDGQRYRLRLAQLIAHAERASSPVIMLADEFGATLDRLTAKVIAANLNRWIRTTAHTFVCATTHDDLLEFLEPDVLLYKNLGDELHVIERGRDNNDNDATDTTTDGEDCRPGHHSSTPRWP
jgi:hypothetical protein